MSMVSQSELLRMAGISESETKEGIAIWWKGYILLESGAPYVMYFTRQDAKPVTDVDREMIAEIFEVYQREKGRENKSFMDRNLVPSERPTKYDQVVTLDIHDLGRKMKDEDEDEQEVYDEPPKKEGFIKRLLKRRKRR